MKRLISILLSVVLVICSVPFDSFAAAVSDGKLSKASFADPASPSDAADPEDEDATPSDAGPGRSGAGGSSYLTFSSSSFFSIRAIKKWNGRLEYSTDGENWSVWYGTEKMSDDPDGDEIWTLYFRGTGNTVISAGTSWRLLGNEIECTGNIETLLDYQKAGRGIHPSMGANCFAGMFKNCTALISAPELPALTLSAGCYEMMFMNCTGLTEPAELPATGLASLCYHNMFANSSVVLNTATGSGSGETWSIPSGAHSVQGWNSMMFIGTQGTFTGDPEIGTIYYVGEHEDVINLSYELNEGQLPEGTVNPDTCTLNQEVIELTAPEKNGYIFTGWNTESEGTGLSFYQTVEVASLTPSEDGSVTLFAQWLEDYGNFLTFSSSQTFSITADKVWDGYLQYSTDTFEWSYWTGESITAEENGEEFCIYIRGMDNTHISAGHSWILSGTDISCSGNIENLLDYQKTAQGIHPAMSSCCYEEMFKNCEALISAPDLRAETLSDYCYYAMFERCTGLTAAPDLPATILAHSCYAGMFAYCRSLERIPVLRAEYLPDNCYSNMFYGCNSLIVNSSPSVGYSKAWSLPADCIEESGSCVKSRMFWATGGSFKGVPGYGTVYYIENDVYSLFYELNGGHLNEGTSNPDGYSPDQSIFTLIPPLRDGFRFAGWNTEPDGSGSSFFSTVDSRYLTPSAEGTVTLYAQWIESTGDFLTFSSSSQFSISAPQKWDGILEYSTDAENWITWNGSAIAAGIDAENWVLYLRGTGNTMISRGSNWEMTGTGVECSGNIETLLDYGEVASGIHPFMDSGCFHCMFRSCTALKSAPELPAESLSILCYKSMFEGCTGLSAAPALPAMLLKRGCYSYMFYGCTALIEAPQLPALKVCESCYKGMFEGCTSLTTAPELPAGNTAEFCYESMFSGCSSLQNVPELKATQLYQRCYFTMFKNCSSLIINSSASYGYRKEWSLPDCTEMDFLNTLRFKTDMFSGTGGTFTGTPDYDRVYYVKSQEVNQITYVLNGGHLPEGTVNPTEIQPGQETLYLTAPEKDGYTFTLWNTEPDGTGLDIISQIAVADLTPSAGGTVTLYAMWEANTYTIAFDGNGSTSGSMSDLTGRKYGTEYTLTANAYKKTGHIFKNWNTKADGTGTSYTDKAKVKNLTAVNGGTATLYAQWETGTYTIAFNGNGSTSGSMSDLTGRKYGTEYTLTANAYTKTGHTFKNWNTKADGTGTSYADKAKVKNLTAENGGTVTLYAQWEVNTYTIAFDGNGSTSGSMSDLTGRKYGTEYTLTANAYKKTGHTFKNWNTKADGTGTAYADKAKVKNLTAENGGTVTLYAQWEANTYTIAFDGNGSTSGSMSSLTGRKYGTEYTLTANAYKKTGHTFKNWNTKADGSGTAYADKAKVKNLTTVNGRTVTLYAQWEANTYTIAFDGNESTSGSMSSLTGRKYGTEYTLTANAYKKTGYTFKNWNTKADGSGTAYANKAKVKNLTAVNGGTVTLYAQWEANTYTISFNGNGSTSGTMTDMTNRKYGKTYTLKANKFKKTGFTFTGWNTKANGTGTSYADKASVTNLTAVNNGTVTLYAQWTANKYTIRFNGNGSTSGSMKALENRRYGRTSILYTNAYKKKGYVFTGWNTKADGSGKAYKNRAEVKNLTARSGASVILYAQWKKNQN